MPEPESKARATLQEPNRPVTLSPADARQEGPGRGKEEECHFKEKLGAELGIEPSLDGVNTERPNPRVPDHEMIRRIGLGAYGEVWLAKSAVGACRAVKVVYRNSFKDDRPYEREFRGIQKFEPISRLNDGFVDILQIGRNDSEGCFYYVMELADDGGGRKNEEGRSQNKPPDSLHKPVSSFFIQPSSLDHYAPKTLRSEIQRCGRLPFEECLQFALSLSQALGRLHRHGLIHRDIKPSNIIFVGGVPKLADIGLVTDLEEARSFVGTEGFIPPEGPNSPQADIYSLGKVLYEMSMGKDRMDFPEPFTALGQATGSHELEELNTVVVKACATNPRDRYQTAEEMHVELALLQSGKSVKSKRMLERRLALLTRSSIAGVMLSAILIAGYFYQQHQTRTSRRLTAQLQINNGISLLDEVDFQGSLLWFAEALDQKESFLSPGERRQDRFRFNAVLQRCPRLTQVIVPDIADGKVADYGGLAEFSPDGRQILISGYGRTVLICDAATRKILQRLEHRANVGRAHFSRDGRRVITWLQDTQADVAGEGQVWNAGTGQRVGQPLANEKKNAWLSGALSEDGKRVLTICGFEAQVWDAETSQKISPVLLHERPVTAGQFSPDGQRVLTRTMWRTGGAAQLWDATTGKKIGPPMKHEGGTMFNGDATRVLTRGTGEIRIWDGFTAQPLLTIAWPHLGDCFFTPDGKRIVLTGWDNGFIQVHEAATGAPIGPTIRQEHGCSSAALSPDGQRIASFCGRHVHVWDLITGQPVVTPIPHNDNCHVAFSPAGHQLLTAGAQNDPVIRLWDLNGAESPIPSMQHQDFVFLAAFSPDNRRIVTASQDERAQLWDAASAKPIGPPLHTNHTADYSLFAHWESARLKHPVSGELVRSVPAELAPTNVFHPVIGDKLGPSYRWPSTNPAVFFATFAPDSKRFVTTSYDGTARVWEADTGLELIPPLKHQGAIFHAAFSRDGRRIVTVSADWTAQVWDAGTGRPVGPPLQHRGAVLYADFSPDGQAVVTASYDVTTQVWNSETGARLGPPLKHWNADNGPVFSAKFSPDGKRILTASYDGTAQVWDAQTGKKITPPLQHRGFVFHATFSPDGQRIVTASFDNTAQLWNAVTGAKATPPLQHGAPVNYATFSADGQRVVTASFDNTARMWDAVTGLPLTPPLRHQDKVWHAEFSPDGRQILTASSDGTARLWPLTPIDWPVTDLRLLAQTLAGRQIDQTGSFSPLAPKTLNENLRQLQSKHPDYFRNSPPKRSAHR